MLGLNFALSSLGRMDGKLVYVLGVRYPDPSGCQLWLDKETLRPMRWLIPADGGDRSSDVLDIRYADWQPVGGIWYPWQVDCYQDGSLARRVEVQEVKIAQGFPDDLFRLDRFEYSDPEPADADKEVQGPIHEVEQAIENFRRLYLP